MTAAGDEASLISLRQSSSISRNVICSYHSGEDVIVGFLVPAFQRIMLSPIFRTEGRGSMSQNSGICLEAHVVLLPRRPTYTFSEAKREDGEAFWILSMQKKLCVLQWSWRLSTVGTSNGLLEYRTYSRTPNCLRCSSLSSPAWCSSSMVSLVIL